MLSFFGNDLQIQLPSLGLKLRLAPSFKNKMTSELLFFRSIVSNLAPLTQVPSSRCGPSTAYKAVIKKSNNTINPKQIKSEIDEISKFCKLKLHGLLNPKIKTEPIEENFKYDILKWIDHYDEKNSLSNYKFKKLEKLVFEYTNDQLKMRNDVFKRYGTDINALSKIVTRISNLESQFRKVRYERDKYLRDVYKRRGENFERYALSN